MADDENKLDVVRNAHKLGLPNEPIPFSYKSGEEARAKAREAAGLGDCREIKLPEHFANLGSYDNTGTINSVEIE